MNTISSSSAPSELVSNNKRMVKAECIETERNALLDIKRGLAGGTFSNLSSWGSSQAQKNCCAWSGVRCDHNTGHVTQLNLSQRQNFYTKYPNSVSALNISSLLHLRNLDYLDLSWNTFSDPNLSSIGSLTNLEHLDLSNADIQGVFLDELGNLSKLSYLDLSSIELSSRVPKFIASFTSLTYLDLSHNYLFGAIPDEFGNLTKLHHLGLSNNNLQGNIPNSISVMTGMTHLNLSANSFEGVLPSSFQNLSRLQIVDFSYNNLSGTFQDVLYLLPEASLQKLWISDNQLTGSLPDITRFSFLDQLKVRSNLLNGYLPKKFEHKSVLRLLDLSNNHLQGSLPNFTNFTFLEDLYLNGNNFFGSLPDFTGCLSLRTLLLGMNQFTDWETQSIGELSNLYQLEIQMNMISSTISEHHLSKLYSLKLINASFNSLIFNMSSEWLPPFRLEELSLSSCKLGPKFPVWIRNQTDIISLDFSSTQISDTLPIWFSNISSKVQKLDLSSNKIRGTFSSMPKNIEDINLSNNYFEGLVPHIPRGCSNINLSHNKFSGKLLSTSEVMTSCLLDLSHNLLLGKIPDSWKYFPALVFLDLGHNNFSGRIPMSLGYIKSLETLILRNNSLDGELPESLRNCTKLGFVDLSFNNLSGSVPSWIGQDLWLLYALVLKSNKLNGSMPNGLCYLLSLRFLDLSINKISGKLPQCLSNLTSMISNGTGIIDHFYKPHDESPCTGVTQCEPSTLPTFSYLDDALASWKGKEQPYKRNFAYLKMIDLSSNGLTGEIPIGITELLGLNGLNLSMNKLYGKVPVQIGGLSNLEVLDLSSNKFSGAIPESLSKITFLSYLNLSSNNFSGKIPLGSQLQSFHSSMYEGNAGLCGLPLTERCPGDDETSVKPEPQSNGNEVDDDENVYERWLYVSVALGFSTSFWGICGTLLVHRRWRNVYFLFLTKRKDQLYVVIAVRIARLKVRFLG
ncbi:receptor-like protein EIX2 [Apium graveolens]|uniref:receptor-like protein EIX2 n=1 Tax=Apium graveolens TaxID=4045 RepID=UPI003D7A7599